MKNRLISLTAALIAATSFCAQNGYAGDASWPLEVFETMDAKRIAVFPTLKDILDSPVWHPGEGPAPLGVDEAIHLAARFETEKGHLANAEVGEIKLLPINDRRAGGRWYYLVKVVDREEAQIKPHFVAILMNGSLVPAIVEPDSVR